MNRLFLIFPAAALAALCFGGAAPAQGSALGDLPGNYGNLDAAVSPAGFQAPVPATGNRAEDEFAHVDPGVVPLGRSWGCPAVELPVRTRLIDTLKAGTVIYAYH